jgi:hypothetical protein
MRVNLTKNAYLQIPGIGVSEARLTFGKSEDRVSQVWQYEADSESEMGKSAPDLRGYEKECCLTYKSRLSYTHISKKGVFCKHIEMNLQHI